MAKQINKRIVSEELYTLAKAHRDRGGKCWLGTAPYMPGAANDCTNCNGGGSLVYQWVVGGPFVDAPAASSGKGRSAIYEKDAWFLVGTRSYPCPVCKGGTAPTAAKPPTKKYPTGQHIDNILEGVI